MFRKILVTAVAAGTLLAGAAQAHPRLLSSTPAARSTGAAPRRIDLNFSERLMRKFSGADLAMAGARKIGATTAVGGSGKTLSLVPVAPLRAGVYQVDYHVVSTDTHRVAGSLVFRVR